MPSTRYDSKKKRWITDREVIEDRISKLESRINNIETQIQDIQEIKKMLDQILKKLGI